MSKASQDQKLFKLILGAIASDSLRSEDYDAALASLRSGKMIEVLDRVLAALATTDSRESVARDQASKSEKKKPSRNKIGEARKLPDDLFDDVKRRKLTRERLEQILTSLDSEFLYSLDAAVTMRAMIRAFYESSSERQWKLLVSIVNGEYEHDPYFNSEDIDS